MMEVHSTNSRDIIKTSKKFIKLKVAAVVASLALVLGGTGAFVLIPLTAHAAACTTVNTSKGTLTAAQVGGDVNGSLDASGCDIGVYYDGSDPGDVHGASIHDANSYGVFVDSSIAGRHTVNISDSDIYNIGNHSGGTYAPNGVQTGVAVYYYGFGSNAQLRGTISNNDVYNYQKGGIVINGSDSKATVTNNLVTGAGPVNYIAQNGIQIGFGAEGTVDHNTSTGNSYTGPNFAASGGVLIYGGCGYQESNADVHDNNLLGNDVGVYSVNYDSSCTDVTPNATKVQIVDNYIRSNAVNNTTGLCNGDSSCGGQDIGYQAGVDDVGNKDTICGNQIGGTGYAYQGKYDYSATPPVFTQTGPNSAVVRHVDAGDTFPTTDPHICGQDHDGDNDNQHDNDSHQNRYDHDNDKHHQHYYRDFH